MLIARVSLTALSLFLSAAIASAGFFSRKKPTELAVRTTAYTHTESDHLQYGRKTAAGGTLKYGRKYSSAAADWSKFPLGTKFKIDGINTTFVVDDYGRALVGTETIDIYKPSKSAMNDWGVKHVDIKILEFGDYEKSREILQQRTKYAHVRKMLAGIDKNPGPKPQKISKSVSTKKPFSPAPPKADRAPAMQLASAPPTPKAPSKPSPAPSIASAPPVKSVAPPAPPVPVIPAPPIPAPAPETGSDSTPTFADTTKSDGNATQPAAQSAVPKAATAPRPSLPAPALRKVKPLQLASLTRSTPPAEPAAAEAPAQEKPAAAPNQLRKRAFRPLAPSVNG